MISPLQFSGFKGTILEENGKYQFKGELDDVTEGFDKDEVTLVKSF